MTKYLLLVFLVAALSKTTRSIDANCNFTAVAAPGIPFHIYSPGYPAYYSAATSCRWYIYSLTEIRLACSFAISPSPNCVRDKLSISRTGDLNLADAENYCEYGAANIRSTGNNLNVVLTTSANTPGGRFDCQVTATEVISL